MAIAVRRPISTRLHEIEPTDYRLALKESCRLSRFTQYACAHCSRSLQCRRDRSTPQFVRESRPTKPLDLPTSASCSSSHTSCDLALARRWSVPQLRGSDLRYGMV